MGLSVAYGAVPGERERHAILAHAAALGCTHIDTAAVYGDSEELIGRWLRASGARGRIFLATKIGLQFDFRTYASTPRGDAAAVRADVARGLQRLGVDVLDLVYVHRIDTGVPIEATMGALAAEVAAGRVRHVGLSEASAATIRRAHAVHPVAAVQCEFSPYELEIESNGVLAAARELGIAVVAYSPLGRGILSGRYRSAADFEEGDNRRSMVRAGAGA